MGRIPFLWALIIVSPVDASNATCVNCEPAACQGGTLCSGNCSGFFTNTTVFFYEANGEEWRTIQVDLNRSEPKFTYCHFSGCHDIPHQKDCPLNDIFLMGKVLLLMAIPLEIGLAIYSCCGGKRGMAVLAHVNHVIFNVGLGMLIRTLALTGPGESLFFNLLMSKLLWDGPMALLKSVGRCSGHAVCFRILVPLWGLAWSYVGILKAYTPAGIAVVGHHPFKLGLMSYTLSGVLTVSLKYAHARLYNKPIKCACVTVMSKKPDNYGVSEAMHDFFYSPVPKLESPEGDDLNENLVVYDAPLSTSF